MPDLAGGLVTAPLPNSLSQGGKGSTLRSTFVNVAALTRVHQWACPRLDTNGNGHTFWEGWFFKLQQPITTGRGRLPLAARLTTADALHKAVFWASRDYALRKIFDDWYFNASSPFGRPVQRSPLQSGDGNGVSGWGSFPLLSRWTTVASLTRDLHYANGGTALQTKMEDWFLGKTAGSADMHILYTLGRYA